MAELSAFETTLLNERLSLLTRELLTALKQVERQSGLQWGKQAFGLFGRALNRRVRNVGVLIKKVAGGAFDKTLDFVKAGKEGRLAAHITEGTKENWGRASTWTQETAASTWDLAKLLKDDRWKVAPELLMMVVVSLVVSGGPDGDGGAPDLDLQMGIGAYRSPLTHSILMGALLEAGIFSLLALVRLVHHKLPEEHDPIWDEAYDFSDRLSTAAAQGASIGMAYHLFVDGMLQPAGARREIRRVAGRFGSWADPSADRCAGALRVGLPGGGDRAFAFRARVDCLPRADRSPYCCGLRSLNQSNSVAVRS